MKIAILTSPNQWLEHYAVDLAKKLQCALFFHHKDIKGFDIVFVLNYRKTIPIEILKCNSCNCVIHESILSRGKGWLPLIWQTLEKKTKVNFTILEKSVNTDNSNIHMQKTLNLTEYELNDEIKEKRANIIVTMCKDFIDKYSQNRSQISQKEYSLNDENLVKNINKKIFPAFLQQNDNRYILNIQIKKGNIVKLIDFTDMTYKEKKMVLTWRNHESIRKWMYHTHLISFNEHLNFIDSLFLSKQKQYMLAKDRDMYLGVISITKIDFENLTCELGIYTNPIHKTKGAGSILQETLIKYVFHVLKFKKLSLDVFENNKKAINLYKKFGFKEISRELINEKVIIHMEIVNENRQI